MYSQLVGEKNRALLFNGYRALDFARFKSSDLLQKRGGLGMFSVFLSFLLNFPSETKE